MAERGKDKINNKVAFWNCNGWGGDSHGGKEKTLGEMAAMEDVEMLCITDTRLDNHMGLRVQGSACNELKKYTGKTWTGHLINRREDGRIGGAIIFYTKRWTGVKIKERVKYGVCTEIKGKWNGVKHTIISIYRPCKSDKEGSLRVSLDYEMKGGLEEAIWSIIGENGNDGLKLIGGDFNMDGEKIDKKLLKIQGGPLRVKMCGNESTFRRMDSVNGILQETTIDHVLTMGDGVSGCKTSDGGMDMNDHAIVIGWVEVKTDKRLVKEMRTPNVPTIRPTDRGAAKKLDKIFVKTTDKELGNMSMDKIIKKTMKQVKIICDNRNNKTNRDGWSPVTRILSMRISVHGTAVKIRGRPDYNRIMKERVEELRRREKKTTLSEEEINWMRDQGIRTEHVDWDEWKIMYRDEEANYEQMCRLKRLNTGRRRKELRMICNDRMYRIIREDRRSDSDHHEQEEGI